MPNGTEYKYTAKYPDGRRVGWDGSKWVPIPAEGGADKFARIFNVAATGSETAPDLWESLKALRGRIGATDPIQALILDPLKEMGEQQLEEVRKRSGPLKYLSAVPFVGPRLTHIAEEKDPTKAWAEFLGTIAGGGIGGKLPELPGKALSVAAEIPERAGQIGKTAAREALNVPADELAKARVAHTAEMQKLQLEGIQESNTIKAENEAKLKAAEEEHAAKVAEVGENNAQLMAEHELKKQQILQDTARKNSERHQAWREKVAKQQREYEDRISGIRTGQVPEAQRATAAATKRKALIQPRSGPVYQRLSGQADKIATEYVPQLDKDVRSAYNARWGAWRQAMGDDAEGNLAPVQQAVVEAEENILKGSPENLAIFRSIMEEGESPILVGAPVSRSGRFMGGTARELEELEPLSSRSFGGTTTLPIDDIRGYVTELQQKRFTGRFEGDVYRALKHVEDAANKEVERVAKERGQLATYNRLRSDWSQYMTDFYDRDGALTKLKGTVNADQRLGLLTGSEGSRIIEAMGRYAKFGADPAIDLAGRTRSAMKQLREMPSTAGAVERPGAPPMPGEEEAKLPGAPRLKETPEYAAPKLKEVPELPDLVPFDVPGWVEERVTKQAKRFGMAGHALMGYWILRDLFHGQMPSASMLAVPVVQHYVRRYLTSPQFLSKVTQMVQ